MAGLAALFRKHGAAFPRTAHFLQPDEAFRVSAAHEADRVLVSWAIADGYYLYRSKFRFSAQAPEAELGNPEFPPAEKKEDPFFGEMEIYRDAVTIVRTRPEGRDGNGHQGRIRGPAVQAKLDLDAQSRSQGGVAFG